jgi:polyhydroxyalkanoate synthesis regulator phasin
MQADFRLSKILALTCGLLLVTAPARADVTPHEQLKQHIRDAVEKVKAAPTAAEKRSILDDELRAMTTALSRARQMTDRSSEKESIDALRARVQEKLDELHGQNGYTAVPDEELDTFADYVQQDFEQADRVVTISVTTALLIVLILLLL